MAYLQKKSRRLSRLAYLLGYALIATAFVLFGSIDYAWPSASSSVHCTVPNTGGAVTLVCTAPDGTTIATTGTTTGGLEESLNYACKNNLSHYIDGAGNGGNLPAASSFVNLSTTLDFRSLRDSTGAHVACPIQGKTIHWDYVTLNWSVALAPPGIIFDSFMDFDFQFVGQLVYPGTGCVLDVVPTNPVPVDGFIVATASHFVSSLISGQASGGLVTECLVKFDGNYGAIIDNTFRFLELNGGGCTTCNAQTSYGIEIVNAASHGFFRNRVDAGDVHLYNIAGILLGQNSADGANIRGNVITAMFAPGSSGSVGLDCWGIGNEFHGMIWPNEIKTVSKSMIGIHRRAGCTNAGNIFSFALNDADTKVIDDNPVVPPLRYRLLDQ